MISAAHSSWLPYRHLPSWFWGIKRAAPKTSTAIYSYDNVATGSQDRVVRTIPTTHVAPLNVGYRVESVRVNRVIK